MRTNVKNVILVRILVRINFRKTQNFRGQKQEPLKRKSPEILRFQDFFGTLHPVSGGDKRDRTADLLNAIQALSQLSYTPRSLGAGAPRARSILADEPQNVKHYFFDFLKN